ncbi:MAG: type II secretion system protein [bacterium]
MKKQTQKGFTLIEVLIGIFILNIMSLGVYGMYDHSLRMLRDKSKKKEALAIANEEMESLRNIEYGFLGTADTMCTPNPAYCNLPPVKTTTRNGINYTILTDIKNIDDVFDNAGGDETGLNDYKTVRIEIQFDSTFKDTDSVVMISNFAPGYVCTYNSCLFDSSNFDGCSFSSVKCY